MIGNRLVNCCGNDVGGKPVFDDVGICIGIVVWPVVGEVNWGECDINWIRCAWGYSTDGDVVVVEFIWEYSLKVDGIVDRRDGWTSEKEKRFF